MKRFVLAAALMLGFGLTSVADDLLPTHALAHDGGGVVVDVPSGGEATELNVICNDGTVSPTCEVCRRGCCSHHGGCR